MKTYRVAAVAVSALSVAACAGGPGLDTTSSQPQPIALEVLSEPPGAEARSATGETCQTPCTLNLPATEQTVTFSLQGFEPETVGVKLVQPERQGGLFSAAPPPRFEPGSIRAQLRPAPRPRRAAPRPAASRPAVTAPSRPTSAPGSTSKPAPKSEAKPAPSGPPPGSPWPPVPGSQ